MRKISKKEFKSHFVVGSKWKYKNSFLKPKIDDDTLRIVNNNSATYISFIKSDNNITYLHFNAGDKFYINGKDLIVISDDDYEIQYYPAE